MIERHVFVYLVILAIIVKIQLRIPKILHATVPIVLAKMVPHALMNQMAHTFANVQLIYMAKIVIMK
jgi:hypothetical protein